MAHRLYCVHHWLHYICQYRFIMIAIIDLFRTAMMALTIIVASSISQLSCSSTVMNNI
jgi:hypothetical protein